MFESERCGIIVDGHCLYCTFVVACCWNNVVLMLQDNPGNRLQDMFTINDNAMEQLKAIMKLRQRDVFQKC